MEVREVNGLTRRCNLSSFDNYCLCATTSPRASDDTIGMLSLRVFCAEGPAERSFASVVAASSVSLRWGVVQPVGHLTVKTERAHSHVVFSRLYLSNGEDV